LLNQLTEQSHAALDTGSADLAIENYFDLQGFVSAYCFLGSFFGNSGPIVASDSRMQRFVILFCYGY
jgi:hypothetical protein